MKKQKPDHFFLTQCTKAIKFRIITRHVSYLSACGCCLIVFSTKHKTKHVNITASRVNYHMTWISTNNTCLKLGISLKFDQLQNISLTQVRHHDNDSSKILLMSSPTLSHFPGLSLATKLNRPFSSSLIGHQNTWLIIISHCSLSFQEFITLHAFASSRSFILPIKPCSILC